MDLYFKQNQYYFIMLRKLIYIENRPNGLIAKIRGPIQIYNGVSNLCIHILYIHMYTYISIVSSKFNKNIEVQIKRYSKLQ